jgi:DNA-binding MarR family transcriptional regulator
MATSGELLHCCLFFTANALARQVTHMAEEEFGMVGLAPSHAFLLMLTMERPGISQKDLAASLHLAPSTVSRFVDALVRRGLVEKETTGKTTHVRATAAGEAMRDPIGEAWKRLYHRYSAKLGAAEGDELTRIIHEASVKLEDG